MAFYNIIIQSIATDEITILFKQIYFTDRFLGNIITVVILDFTKCGGLYVITNISIVAYDN